MVSTVINESSLTALQVSIVNLFLNFWVFLVGLGNLSEFLGFFMEVSQEFKAFVYVVAIELFVRSCPDIS